MKDDESRIRSKIFKDQQNSLLTIQCFKQNNLQMAYDLVKELLKTDPNNPVLFQIKGACQMLSKDRKRPQQALVSYGMAMKLNPQNLAYVNNFGCVQVSMKQYRQGLQILKPIQNKWKHPSIYINILRCYQNLGMIQEVMTYIQKKNQAETYFPDYQKHNGLIHSFLSDDKQNTGYASILNNQIRDNLKALQIQFIISDKFSQLSQSLSRNISIRKQQQDCYGILLDNQMKIILIAATNFLQITKQIKKNYKQSRQSLLSIIQEIDQLVSGLYTTIKENNVQSFTQKELQHKVLNPFNDDCQKNRYRLLKFTNLFNIDEQFQNEQNDNTRYTRRFIKKNQYHFLKRDEDIYDIQNQKIWKLSLRIQKDSENSLAKLFKDQENTFVQLKPAVFLQSNSMNRQCRTQIQKLSENKKQFFSKFYWAMTLMIKFYNYYEEKDVQYFSEGKETSLSNLNLTQFIQQVYPLFPQIPIEFDLFQNIGRICRQIHYGIVLYLVECQKKNLNRFMRKAMTKIKKICQYQNSISEFVLQIILNQHHVKSLMKKQAQSKTKQKHLDYFRWRIFSYMRYHEEEFSDKLLTRDDELLIENCIMIMLGLMEVDDSDLNGLQVLMKTFSNCHIKTVSQADLKSVISEELYRANHAQTALEKVKHAAIKALKKIFL